VVAAPRGVTRTPVRRPSNARPRSRPPCYRKQINRCLKLLTGNEENRHGEIERRAAGRVRHLNNPADLSEMMARLTMMVSAPAKWQLERLAIHYGITKRAMLERALDEVERRVVADMPSRAQEDYFERRGAVTS
jgi:hypothetical protein